MKINKLEKLNEKFRVFEKHLGEISYPENELNKIMSIILSNINSLELIQTRYEDTKSLVSKVNQEDAKLRRENPDARVFPVHPDENYAYAAIRVDVESVFIFGLTLVHKMILLLRPYLADEKISFNRRNEDQYATITYFYRWLCRNDLSPLAQKLKSKVFQEVKWLYAVLRFYRNEFIEHLDKGYQQGMGFDGDRIQLHSFGWGTGSDEYNKEILDFKAILVSKNINLPYDHNRPRYYAQLMFNNIVSIPDDMIENALRIIEKNGVETPTAPQVINHINNFCETIFDFLSEEIDNSLLSQYKRRNND